MLEPPAAGFVERYSSFYRSLVYFVGMRAAAQLRRRRDAARSRARARAARGHRIDASAAGIPLLVVSAGEPWLDDLPHARHIDVAPALARAGEPVEFAHDPHWNVAGHRIVAAEVAAALRPPTSASP